MKHFIFLILFLFTTSLNASSNDTQLILKEIQNLRDDMNKRFEQVDKRFEQVDKRFKQVDKRFEQVDKRFKQVDKRFEQVDKRLDVMQNILYILMGLIFASPFIAIYLKDKKELEQRKVLDNVKAMMFVMRELAQDDDRFAKALKSASLM